MEQSFYFSPIHCFPIFPLHSSFLLTVSKQTTEKFPPPLLITFNHPASSHLRRFTHTQTERPDFYIFLVFPFGFKCIRPIHVPRPKPCRPPKKATRCSSSGILHLHLLLLPRRRQRAVSSPRPCRLQHRLPNNSKRVTVDQSSATAQSHCTW